jgi:hypothetical protein
VLVAGKWHWQNILRPGMAKKISELKLEESFFNIFFQTLKFQAAGPPTSQK